MTQEGTTANSGWQKWRFSAPQIPIAIGMINPTLVLRINPAEMRDGKNRHLRQAANCWRQALRTIELIN